MALHECGLPNIGAAEARSKGPLICCTGQAGCAPRSTQSHAAELNIVGCRKQVVSKKSEKTIIVAVEQLKTHRIYGKRMRQTHRFQVCLF